MEIGGKPFVEYKVASGNSYKKKFTRLTTLLFSVEFSDYGTTIVLKLSLRFIHSTL